MASETTTPKYLLQEELLSPECKEFISTLPAQNGWQLPSPLYQYQGFWHAPAFLQGLISCQKHFKPQDSDVLLVTTPKSGTTWLKAIMFALLNRQRHPIATDNHPLLARNPHDVVPFLEIQLYAHNQIPDIASFPSPRLFATHMPYVSLPESLRNSSKCKLLYLCRNPKDTFVSTWHFTNKLRTQEMVKNQIEDVLERFCNGINLYGPFWDHVLQYWKLSVENPERVMFLKYEDMKEQPQLHLRRVAEFFNCPLTADEEESGLADQILKFCSFDHLSSLEVNKNGKLSSGVVSNAFFRRGEVGDWKNYLSAEMVQKLDQITREKFRGTGLELL